MKLKKMLQGGNILRNEAPEGGEAGGGTPPPAELPPLIDDNLNFSEGYQERIGEFAEGATFKNLPDVFKTAKEAQRTITQLNQEKSELTKKLEGSAVPPKELPADAEAFKKQLELPELPEGLQLDDKILDEAVNYALEKGYGPKELSDFMAFDLKRAELEESARKNAEHEKVGNAKNVIIESVGEQNYETTIDNAKFASETLGLPLDAETLVENPQMVLALSKLKDSLSEGTLKGASLGGISEISNGGKLAQAEDIVSNEQNSLYQAFHDPSHPQHSTAIQTHARLITESSM